MHERSSEISHNICFHHLSRSNTAVTRRYIYHLPIVKNNNRLFFNPKSTHPRTPLFPPNRKKKPRTSRSFNISSSGAPLPLTVLPSRAEASKKPKKSRKSAHNNGEPTLALYGRRPEKQKKARKARTTTENQRLPSTGAGLKKKKKTRQAQL